MSDCRSKNSKISMKLEFEMTYRIKTKGPLISTGFSPYGEKQYWEISEGLLLGPRIKAIVKMPGGDWMHVSPDGFWRPDVRLQLETDDKAIIPLSYTGLVEQSKSFTEAARAGKETQWTDQYMRMVMQFETGVEKYSWLNKSIFIAEGRLINTYEIEYRIYRLT